MGDVSIATKSRMGDPRSVYAFQPVESDGTCTSGFKKKRRKKNSLSERRYLDQSDYLVSGRVARNCSGQKAKTIAAKEATFAMIIVQRS